MKLTKTHLFSIGLAVGLVAGNLLSSFSWRVERNEMYRSMDEIRTIVIENKLKSNSDSIKYNDKIADMAALYYRLELENRELKDKQVIANSSGK